MNNLDHISESLETIVWVKILKFFDAYIRDPGRKTDPGSWMKKFGSGIRNGKNSDTEWKMDPG
jgi:hypothetical protein